jgi:hypothetical protein
MQVQLSVMIDLLERNLMRIDRLGDDPRAVVIRHHFVFALLWNTRYRDAAAIQSKTSPMADRLGDSQSKAYSLAGEIHVSTMIEPKSLHDFEKIKSEAIKAASETTDAHIQSWVRFVIGWEEFHRGRATQAKDAARELMQIGQKLNDPRPTGQGLGLLSWIALVSDSYAEALEHSEQSLSVAIAPLEIDGALSGKGCALVLLRQTGQGAAILGEARRRCVANGNLYPLVGCAAIIGVCSVLNGDIKGGTRHIQQSILLREKEGYGDAADWYRLFLAEVYLQIIAGNEKLAFLTLLRNLPTLLKVMATASSRIRSLMTRVLQNPHFDPGGNVVGRAQMNLGLLYQAKKKRGLAVQHLTEAQRIISKFGQTPVLARIHAALVELG